MRRRLPLFVEQSLQEMQAARISLADDFDRKIRGERMLSCGVKCAACCYHPVFVTILEAVPLYGALVSKGLWTPSLKERLRKHAEMVTGLSVQVWLLSKIACPLLKDQRCTAYEARPLSCRVTIATGDPFYCDPQHLGDQSTIVEREEPVREFRARETDILRRHGLTPLHMPLSRAILMAERVCSGQLMLENIDRTYVLDYLTEGA